MPKIIITLTILLCLLIGLVYFDFQQYLSLEYIQDKRNLFSEYYNNNKLLVIIVFFVVYIIFTSLALPSATLLTLLAGSIFGFWTGLIIVSFASSIGATLSFLIARFLLFEYFSNKYSKKHLAINEAVKKEGAFYIFSMRMIPIFPFFIVNILMGLTAIKTRIFYVASQIGMLPSTAIYVYTGKKLSEIKSLGDVFSFEIFIALTILGLFPLIVKIIISRFKYKEIYKKYSRPKKFDYNLIVIGGGAAGLVSSYIASSVKAKVLLVEGNKTGGDCLYTGCVPSKTLIKSAQIAKYINNSSDYGFKKASYKFDFKDIMQNVQSKITKIEPHDSFKRYEKLGVNCKQGFAKIIDPFTVKINDEQITAPNIVIATGAKPFVPKFKNIDKVNYYTSDSVWQLKNLPKKFLIIGGGAIGCELGQAFARLGSVVTIVESQSEILANEDDDIRELISKKLVDGGINILVNHKVIGFDKKSSKQLVVCGHEKQQVNIEFDEVIIAIGRKANVNNFGLEDLKITLDEKGKIKTNKYLQTNYPNIYACGDVQTNLQFTNIAAHEAWYASVNALFSSFKKFAVIYDNVPFATFTDPQIARVGLNENMAKQQKVDYEITTYDISDLDRAIIDSDDYGLIKVLTKPKSDKILGVTITSANAAEIIAEFVLAMKNNIGLNKILSTPHIYPSFAEANKYVAGNWRKKNKPVRIMKILKWYFNKKL